VGDPEAGGSDPTLRTRPFFLWFIYFGFGDWYMSDTCDLQLVPKGSLWGDLLYPLTAGLKS